MKTMITVSVENVPALVMFTVVVTCDLFDRVIVNCCVGWCE